MITIADIMPIKMSDDSPKNLADASEIFLDPAKTKNLIKNDAGWICQVVVHLSSTLNSKSDLAVKERFFVGLNLALKESPHLWKFALPIFTSENCPFQRFISSC